MTVLPIDGPEVLALRAPALSPSRASDFKHCPLLYRLRAIDRLPSAPTRAQLRGTLVHAALEALYALPAAQRTPEAARALVGERWPAVRAAIEPSPCPVVGDEETRLLAEASALVSNYFDLENPRAFDPESCEQRVETTGVHGVPLRGFIDRLDVAPSGALRVVDYKTGRTPGERSESTVLFQMKFYAVALLRLRDVVPAELRAIYLGDRRILTYVPDREELHRFERTLAAIWAAIREAGDTGDFRPSPGRQCSWCEHRALCPAFGGQLPDYPGWPGGTGSAELRTGTT